MLDKEEWIHNLSVKNYLQKIKIESLENENLKKELKLFSRSKK